MAITRDELKAGVEYVVNKPGSLFSVGEVVVLLRDDGSSSPWFKAVDGDALHAVHLSKLDVYKKEEGKKMKNFTKADLKDWMVVERRNGHMEVVCIAQGLLLDVKCGHNHLDRVNVDLTSKNSRKWDVVAVYSHFGDRRNSFSDFKIGNLIWKREEKTATQLKIEEIEKKQRELADELEELIKSGV